MPCEVCGEQARITVDGHIFCVPHYEAYFYKQPKGVLDWEPYYEEEQPKKPIKKEIKKEEKEDIWSWI